MVKIKTKKKMSPEEYAKYMIDKHGISGLEYELIDDNIIDAPKRYTLTFELNSVSMKEISDVGFENKEFTIEVEETVTKYTMFRELVGLRADGNYRKYDNTCISDFNLEVINAIYIPNDDLTMTLIWKDGKLVE